MGPSTDGVLRPKCRPATLSVAGLLLAALLSAQLSDPHIGVHVLEIRAHKWAGEPDTLDNRARVVFLIDPRDYATGVLEDAWDMTEATSGAPDWKTDDISGMRGWESFSDSISGMFEGSISDPSSLNRMVLNTGSGASDSVDTSVYDMLS